MRSLFMILLFSLVLAVEGDKKSHFLVGTPWYSDFLEDLDELEDAKKPMTGRRRKGTSDKPKEISAKKVKGKEMDLTTPAKGKELPKRGWFGGLTVDDVMNSLE